nr:PREDICTED: band 4.1-like protein 5 isoform X3 [Equus przewalskii]
METSQAPDDINIAAGQTGLEEPEVECGTLKDASEKLKHLEMENSPLLSSRPNIDVNINNQEEVVKLTEKYLNNAIESPGLNVRRLPPDLKSNILKAQVEAVHKVTREGSLLSHKNAKGQDAATNSAVFNESNVPLLEDSLALMHTTPAENGSVLKVSSASMIIPRWIVPQSTVLPDGLVGKGPSLAGKEGRGDREVVSLVSPPAPFLVDAVTSPAPTLAEEAVLKQKCLLTTEL